MMEFPQHKDCQRINVIGTSGSGKSTFARKLSDALSLPYYEMDSLFWKPAWQESSDDEFMPKIEAVTTRPRWVLDGNYKRTTKVKWQQVQLVVWMDTSFTRTMTRVTRRAIQRSLSQRELWPGTGNRESLVRSFLSPKSIILWSLTSFRRNRRKYAAMMSAPEYAAIRFIRLRSPTAANSCLGNCSIATRVVTADPSSRLP